jgi:hypothetical protein
MDGWFDGIHESMGVWFFVCMDGWMKWNVYGLVCGCINGLIE